MKRRLRNLLFLVFCWLIPVGFQCQVDTILKRVWSVGYPVTSVFNQADDAVYITGGRGLEVCRGVNAFEILDPQQSAPLFWTGDSLVSGSGEWFKHFPYSPYDRFQHWRRFFSSPATTFTEAQLDSSHVLVCDGNRLYEFEFVSLNTALLNDCSVRGFAWVNGRLVANTYSGVFWDTMRLENQPEFNDGAILVLQDTVYSMGQYVVKWPVGRPEARIIVQQPQTIRLPSDQGLESLTMARKDGILWRAELYWYSYSGFGVYRFGEFKPYTDLSVLHVVELDEELILFTRGQGVFRFDGSSFEQLDLPEGVSFYDVALLDAGGPKILASDHGLCIWDEAASSLEFVGIDEGLPSSIACSIIPDEWGTFWVSTFAGVIRYDLERGILAHHSPLIEFNRFSKGVSPDGRIAFGSTDGIHLFETSNPDLPRNVSAFSRIWFLLLIAGIALGIGWLVRSRRILHQQVVDSNQRMATLEKESFRSHIREIVYADLSNASVNTIADGFEMSRRTFYRKCSDYGIRPSAIIREIRVTTALNAMEKENVSIAEAASRVGYSTNHLRRLLGEEETKGMPLED